MSDVNNKANSQLARSASLGPADVYFVLFRRKWFILAMTLVGLVAAVGYLIENPPPYTSEARLMVRYVIDSKPNLGAGGNSSGDIQNAGAGAGGQTVIASEIDVLTSSDLAEDAAKSVGPVRILAKHGGGSNQLAAARVVMDGLAVEAPKKSTVIFVRYSHPDPVMAVTVLKALVEAYLKKHVEIHRPLATFDDYLTQETDKLRSRLSQTEEELRALKMKSGILDAGDIMKSVGQRMMKVSADLLEASADYNQQRAMLAEVERIFPTSTSQSNNAASPTNQAQVAQEVVDQYKQLRLSLIEFQRKESEVLIRYTEENPVVKNVRQQIEGTKHQVKKMEAEHPQLLEVGAGLAANDQAGSRDLNPASLRVRAASVAARMKTLEEEYTRIRSEATNLDSASAVILTLQRKRDIEATNYEYFLRSLEMARTEESLTQGRTANIGIAQSPSAPYLDGKKTQKIVAGIAVGGFAGSLALSFLLELVLNQTIRRPKDIEDNFSIPLFMTIPHLKLAGSANGRSRKLLKGPEGETLEAEMEMEGEVEGEMEGEAPLGSPAQVPREMQPYVEALRDRLSVHLEKFKHKPKLVAVAGLTAGAGTSTIATGLAAAMSEMGDGKVLLVDMNEASSAHSFYRGKHVQSLASALEQGVTQGETVGNQNLFLATLTADGGKRSVLLPSRFANLVPKLVATDYDYIIFDMPPVSATSITPRLARLMDTTLLVVEAEKTQSDLLKGASALLQAHKADSVAVLNKRRQYVPQRLVQEI